MAEQKKAQDARKTGDAIKLMRQVLSRRRAKPREGGFLWQDIAAAIAEIVAVRTPETEEMLTRMLEHTAAIPLAPESDLTHAMPPEDVVRAAAIGQLGEWTGKKHLKSFKKIQASTRSPVLRSIAEVEIARQSQRATAARPRK